MFCLAANTNAPHNNTPMLGVHEPKSHFASILIFSLFAATWVIAAVIPLKVMPRFSLKTFGLILTIAALIVLAAVTKLRHDNRVGSLELEILALSKHSEELARETEGLRQRIESVINQLCQLLETEGMASAPLDGNATSHSIACLLYTSPSPRDLSTSRMPSSA